MANLKPSRVPDSRALADTALVAASAGGDTIDGHANVAIVRNGGASPITVTVWRPGEVTNQTVTVAAGAIHLIRTTSANRLTYSAVTSVTVGFFNV